MDLLVDRRFVTLIGAPGVGKTRLALQVAAKLTSAFADGVWFVELASLSDPLLVPGAITKALGIPEQIGSLLLTTLAEYLKNHQLLLVLDNCEHLATDCAAVVEGLLQACSGLRVLATSREALRAEGEVRWRVPSLSNPEPSYQPPPGPLAVADLARYEAIRLFAERAHATDTAFTLTEQNATAVIEICQRLEGIPLALELAAARVPTLTVEQIAVRLDDQLALLTQGRRTSPPRQQTLRATLDWSFNLLTRAEQLVLSQLAVFTGGWTLEAAEAVCVGDEIVRTDIVNVLARLIDASLVVRDDTLNARRFRLLEPVRQYALAWLQTTPVDDESLARHAAYWLALLEEARRGFRGPQQHAWLDRVAMEHDNVRASLAWALSSPHRTIVGLRLLGAIWWFWWTRGHLTEGRRWLDRGLAAGDGAPAELRAELLYAVGCLACSQAAYDEADARYAESFALYRALRHRAGVANALAGLAHVARDRGVYDQAGTLFEESLALFRDLDDQAGIADATGDLGYIAQRRGDYQQATARYGESLALSRAIGDTGNIAWLCCNLGDLAYAQGAEAQALTLYGESLVLRKELQDRAGVADVLDRLAAVAARSHPSLAARLCGAVDTIRETIGAPRALPHDAPGMPDAIGARAALSNAQFAEAWIEGQAMSTDCAVTIGLELTSGTQTVSPDLVLRTPDARRPTLGPGRAMPLTARECEVAAAIGRGLSNRAIAAELVIAVRTVHAHVGNILGKLDFSSRAQVAVWARDHDLLPH